MSDDRYRDKHSGTSVNGHNNSEQRAREQAYQEYLSLRENRSSRGNYVKDDTLYGAYFPSGNSERKQRESRSSIDDTPYGSSEMRRRRRQKETE